MSKKKYNPEKNREVGCNKKRGWLLSAEQISLVRFYLYLAGVEFKVDARRKMLDGMPKSLVLNEMRKYREVTAVYNDLRQSQPSVYVRA